MRGAELVTPGVLAMLCLGLVIFMLVFWLIFRKKTK